MTMPVNLAAAQAASNRAAGNVNRANQLLGTDASPDELQQALVHALLAVEARLDESTYWLGSAQARRA
ncbi:MAG: hypothetical protein ICV69_11855 [Thermoleophilaceae bacterium]|nr:hypothetical protein [Thermoleophilaceae bacterium]